MKRIFVLSSFLVGLGLGQGLLVNGDFEQDLSVGWKLDTSGTYIGVDRIQGYGPDSTWVARDSMYGFGHSRLYQIVDVPGSRLSLSFQAAFDSSGGSSSCWLVAAVVVGYYDSSSTLLGQTRFYLHNPRCNWRSSGTLSLIDVKNKNWSQYSLDVSSELSQRLPGVNPGAIKKLGVALFDTTTGG
jgi:hypothetical protein